MARRTEKPAYVGCSAVFENAVDEEIAAFKAAVDGIMDTLGVHDMAKAV